MEINKKIEALLPAVFEENKFLRRNALQELKQISIELLNSERYRDINLIYSKIETALFSALSDSSEINRIEASLLMIMFMKKCSLKEKSICNLISILHHRIGKIPFSEDSEDVKLELLTILNLTLKANVSFIQYMSDIIDILAFCLLEKYAEIILLTFDCIDSLAIATKNKFQLQSASLIKPLIKCLSNHRFKIRCKTLEMIGQVLLKGDPTSFEILTEPLGLCVKDIPQVRLQLVKLGYTLGTQFSERYSYWPKILPLILFGLRDADNEIKTYSIDCWKDIGAQYEREIEDVDHDIKSYIPKQKFIDAEIQYGIGCQILAQKSLSYLVRCIDLSVDDWQVDTRLKASQLLTALIINGQDSIIQYSNQIIPILCIAANDSEKEVRSEAFLACKHFGFFVSPKIYLKILEQHFNTKMSHEIFLSFLSGTTPGLVQEFFVEALELLHFKDITFSIDLYYPIISIISLFVSSCDVKSACKEMLLPLLYFSTCEDVDEKLCLEALDKMANKCGFQDVTEMITTHSQAIMKEIETSVTVWDDQSTPFMIFTALSRFHAIEENMDSFGIVCSCIMSRKDCPIVQFKLMEIIQNSIRNGKNSINNELESWIAAFIAEYIYPLLKWSPGNTAGALRTAAIGFLLSMTLPSEYSAVICQALRTSIIYIPQLITDENEQTRHLTCKFIQKICKSDKIHLDNKILLSFAEILIKRLDDKKSAIRLMASEALPVVMTLDASSLEEVRDSVATHIESLLIYLDEDDALVRKNIFDTLRIAGEICPKYLMDELKENGHKFRNEELCNKLANEISLLKIQ